MNWEEKLHFNVIAISTHDRKGLGEVFLSETFNKAKHKDTLALLDEGWLQLPNT
jgi:hypothetical protein